MLAIEYAISDLSHIVDEVVLTVRTWAVWEHNRRVGICLWVFFIAIWTSVTIGTWLLGLEGKWYSAVDQYMSLIGVKEVLTVPTSAIPSGCEALLADDRKIVANYSLVLVFEGGKLQAVYPL